MSNIPHELNEYLADLMAWQKRVAMKTSLNEPRVGFFWMLPSENIVPNIVGFGIPASEAYPQSGFRTDERSHYDTWEILSKCPPYSEYDYEYWPRGRVNFIEDTGLFLILGDKKLNNKSYKNSILKEFNIPEESVTYDFSDIHYTSTGNLTIHK